MVLKHDCKHLILAGREKIKGFIGKEEHTIEKWECELGIHADTPMGGCPDDCPYFEKK